MRAYRCVAIDFLFLSSFLNSSSLHFFIFLFAFHCHRHRHHQAIKGSVPWMAPEVIRQSGHGRKADIWSVGATVIEMLTAKHPWPNLPRNLSALFHIATSDSPPPLPKALQSTLSAELIDFVYNCCLCMDPGERMPASELLSHPFLNNE